MLKNWVRPLIGFSIIKIIFLLIFISVIIGFWSFFNGFLAIIFSLKPPSTATTISYYSSDSFYGLPIEINDKNTDSILKKGFFGKKIVVDSLKSELNSIINAKLKLKFGNKYNAYFYTFENGFNGEDGVFYKNFINLTNGLENIIPFGFTFENTEIPYGNEGRKESIFFYSKINEFSNGFDKYKTKILEFIGFGNGKKRLGYASPNNDVTIMFLKQDDITNLNEQIKSFEKRLREAKGNDGKIKNNNKEAYEYIFSEKSWNKSDVLNIKFYPNQYGDILLGKVIDITDSCKIKYVNTENDFNCDDGIATIKITDNYNSTLPINSFNNGIEIINVKGIGYNEFMSKLRNLIKLLIENNNITFNNSYFVDMLNFVGTNESNSNQKVLSQQKIDLSVFSGKQFGKDYNSIIINAGVLQNFSLENAKKMMYYKKNDDTSFSYVNIEKNNVEIFKNGGGYSTPGQKYRCIKGRYVVYKNFEELVFGTIVTDDRIPKKCNASPWKAPGILKQAEIKYYKKIFFKGESFVKNDEDINSSEGITKVGNLYNKEDYKLNFFYHYDKPEIKIDNNQNIISNIDYISHIGLDKKSIIWRGIYLKVTSYAGEIRDDMPGSFVIKRDSKDGNILFENSPVKFELGLLTELDDKEKVYIKSGKNFIQKEIISEDVVGFKKDNINKNDSENSLLSKFLNQSIFDKIDYKEFISNKMLSSDVSVIYGQRKIKDFNNEYVTLLDKQKKIIDILDRKFLGKTLNGTYSMSIEGVLKKYITLESLYPGTNKSMNLCTKYDSISNIGRINMTKEMFFGSSNDGINNIKRKTLEKISNLYKNCVESYYKQGKVVNDNSVTLENGKGIGIKEFIEKKYGLTNTIYKYPFSTLDPNVNDIYFLYKSLNDNVKYKNLLNSYEKIENGFIGFYLFYNNYFNIQNFGEENYRRKKLDELYKSISNIDDNIKYNPHPEIEFKEGISKEDRYYVEQEYLNMEIIGDKISDQKKEAFLKLSGKELTINNDDKTPFFNIKKAFSFGKSYNKETGLTEIPLNPNIYLYSFFHYTIKNNKSYNINISNEQRLMHYQPDYNKYELDKEFLYWYSDQISKNVLNEMTLQEYRNVYASLNENNSFLFGGLSNFDPSVDEQTLEDLSMIANSSINKVGFINKVLSNSALYSQINDVDLGYLPIGLIISTHYLKNEKNENKKNILGRFILQIKLVNLISKYEKDLDFYKSVNSEDGIKITNIRLDLLKYIFLISSGYYNKDHNAWIFDSLINHSVKDIIEYAIKDYYNSYYKDEYKEKTKNLFGTYVNAGYDKDGFYSMRTTEIVNYLLADSDISKDPYLNKEYTDEVSEDKELRNFAIKYLGRFENPSGKYSRFSYENNSIDYSLLKKSFEKILSSTGSISIENNSNTGSENNSTGSLLNNSGSDNNVLKSLPNEITKLKYDLSGIYERSYNYYLLKDIEQLKIYFIDIDTFASNNNISTESFIRILQNNKNCMNFLKSNSKFLYYTLYSLSNNYDTLQNISGTGGLTTEEKVKIFSYLKDKKILSCKDMEDIKDYKLYLDYVNLQISTILSHKTLLDLSFAQEFNLFTGINYVSSEDLTYVLGSNILKPDGIEIKKTPIYKILSKTFNYNYNKDLKTNKKNTYKFVVTTENGIPLKIKETEQYNKNDLMYIYYNLFLAETISNNIHLFDGLKELSKELFNYSLNNDKKIIAYISEFKNLGPFYFLYTNNGYVNPEEGVSFIMVDKSNSGNNGIMLNVQGLGMERDKAGINAGLDNLSQKYCEQQEGNKKEMCKKYIQFLKGLSLADYKQELDWLDAYIRTKEIVGSYPSVGSRTEGPFVITQQNVINRIKSINPNIYKRMQKTYYGRKANTYIGQCTWNVHLYKDRDLGGNGKDYYQKARNNGIPTQNYSGLPVEEKIKIIQVGDIISFFGWPKSDGCNYSGNAGKYGHVAVVIDKNENNKTITIAESNYKSLFITNTRTLNVEKMCDGAVIHNVNKRYEKTNVTFLRQPLVESQTQTGNTSSGTTNF